MLAEAPWTITRADVEKLRAAGLNDAALLHVVVLASYFNYLNRVADAVDIEFDYESPLPKMVKDASREPLPLPSQWPAGPAPLPLRLAQRPNTHAPFRKWEAYVLEREAPLPRRERRVLARAVAGALADRVGQERFEDAAASSPREQTLARFAQLLTATPWRLDDGAIAGLKRLGLDDLGVLDVISVASFQNTASRLNLVLAEV